MATNVKLSSEQTDEEDERLLEDTVFPYIFGRQDKKSDTFPAAFDFAVELKHVEKGELKAVAKRAEQFQDMLRWYQAIGTPCGFYLFQALQSQSKLMQSASLRITTNHPGFELEVPLFPWLRMNVREWTAHVKAGGEHAAPFEVLVKSLRTWLNLDRAVGVISGEAADSFRASRNAFVLLDKWLGGTEELALSLPQGGNPDEAACALEAGIPLGTNAIGLSASHVAACLYVYRLEEAAKKEGIEFDGTPHYKGSSFDLFALALYDKSLIGRRPKSEVELLTYLAASDLALFTPLHPMFTALRSSHRWDDLHPGYRLKKILATIKEEKLQLESSSASDYFKFSSKLCSSLNWPEIPRFIDTALGSTLLDSEDPVRQFFKQACQAREKHPAAFFDPSEAIEHLGDMAPPGSQLAEVETSRDTDLALTFALEAELYAAGFQLFFGKERPDFVCPDYTEVISLLHSAPEMLKTYFGLEF